MAAMKNTFAAIRDLIPDDASAKRPGEIAALLPEVNPQRIRESIGWMFHHGILGRAGNRSDGFRYYVIRAVKRKAYATDEERKAAKRAYDAKRNWAQVHGRMTMVEWRAEQARRKAATAARRAREAAGLRADLEAKRAAEKAETLRVAEAKAAARTRRSLRSRAVRTLDQRLLAHEPAIPVQLPDAPMRAPAPKVETVAEWMARTGNRPQVLPVAWNEARAA